MRQIKSKIIFNQRVKNNYYHLAIDGEGLIDDSLPGMFLDIKVNNLHQPFLRRPISIHSVKRQKIEILYEIVGQGTEILSAKRPGECLDVIGPLGNGFKIKSKVSSGGGSAYGGKSQKSKEILVAGGMGVAPLVFLAERLMPVKPVVLIGAKTKEHILCEKEFRDLGCEVKIATDDGSKGYNCRVTDLLKEILRKNSIIQERYNVIYACGPKPMLREISGISRQYKIPAQVSLEAHMACGIGACLGCVVNTREGFKRVCKEGPVFSSDEIIWEG